MDKSKRPLNPSKPKGTFRGPSSKPKGTFRGPSSKPKATFRRPRKPRQRRSKGSFTKPPWPPVIRPRDTISYDNLRLIRTFISDHGQILARRVTKITLKQQRLMTKAIKRARLLGFLPFRSTPRFFKMQMATRKKLQDLKAKRRKRTFKGKRTFKVKRTNFQRKTNFQSKTNFQTKKRLHW